VDRFELESIFNEPRKKENGSERYWNGQLVQ